MMGCGLNRLVFPPWLGTTLWFDKSRLEDGAECTAFVLGTSALLVIRFFCDSIAKCGVLCMHPVC